MTRPLYSEIDEKEKEAQRGSRTDTIGKNFALELWMAVILKAIDDIVLYQYLQQNKKEITEEDKENNKTAMDFLFDNNHRIPFDDYYVDIICPKCEWIKTEKLSLIAGRYQICPSCFKKTSWKFIQTQVSTKKDKIKEISLEELLSLWGIEDISVFRKGLVQKIKFLLKKKIDTKLNKKKQEVL